MSLTLPNRKSLAPTGVISLAITPFPRPATPNPANASAAVKRPLFGSSVTLVLTPTKGY
jgi:hypothetical protein